MWINFHTYLPGKYIHGKYSYHKLKTSLVHLRDQPVCCSVELLIEQAELCRLSDLVQVFFATDNLVPAEIILN